MRTIKGPWHETRRHLIDNLSIAVEDDVIQQVRDWIVTGLAGMELPRAAQSRLATALANQVTSALERFSPVRPRTLTLSLFSIATGSPTAQGLGFFIVNKPSQDNQCLLEIYIYGEPPA